MSKHDKWPESKKAKFGLTTKAINNVTSNVPDSVIDAIADSMDAKPEQAYTSRTPKTRLRTPTPESDAAEMIAKYIKQNGGIVLKNEKKHIESHNKDDDNLICG